MKADKPSNQRVNRMPKVIAIMWFCLSFSISALAGIGDLEIHLVNKNVMNLQPGATANIVIKLINPSETNRDFILKIKTPQDWKCLTNFNSVTVEKESTKLKFLSIYIPEVTKAGDYTLSVWAYDKSDNHEIGMISIPFFVAPKYQLSVDVYQAPQYVVSGDSMTVKFRIQNLSNAEAKINSSIRSQNKTKDHLYLLAPDSFIVVRKTIVTKANLLHSTKENISLEASIADHPETRIIQYHYFDVISSHKTRFDPYDRFPVEVSPLLVTGNRSGKRDYAFMIDVKGKSIINEEKGSVLDFHFRGPNRVGKSLLGIYDEKYIKYTSPHSDIVVGDNNYSLSYLTEQSRYGRGVAYQYTLKKLQIGSFIAYPRFYPQLKREYAFFTNYSSAEKYTLKAGYLNKQFATNTSAHLLTVSGVFYPFHWVNMELEYATGKVTDKYTHAYKTAVNANYSVFRLFFNYTMADNLFPGYFSNSEYLSTSLSARISKKINFNFNYNFNHNNMALDTLFTNAPFSENLGFSANYSINPTTSASMGWSERERDDRMTPKKFHYNEKSILFSVNKKVHQLGINMRGETGKTTNFLITQQGQLKAMYRADLTLKYRLNDHVIMNGFVNYSRHQRYNVEDNRNWYYGGSLEANMGKKVSVTVNYQNNYQVEEYYRDRSILSLNSNFKINPDNQIGAWIRYNLAHNTLDKRELEIMVRYTHTLHVPFRKKKDLGSLRGKIINNGVDNIEGLVVTFGGNTTITDKSGEFRFPVIKKGTDYLMVDPSNAGLFAIAEKQGPYQLDIMPGIENHFELTLTKSVKISGNTVVVDEQKKGDKGFVTVKAKLNRLIVEAKNGDQVYRVYTDEKGSFAFEGLRPGNWEIQVYKNGLSKELELLTEYFSLNLVSGQNQSVEIKVKEKQRRIKFQKDL